MNSQPKPVIVITGPTAAGKSEIVYSLPPETPIEIINADSRQIYRHMSIGTALPAPHELNRFRHHMFAHVDPYERYSAGRFIKEALAAIAEIQERGRIAVIVGGTFFYIRSLWDGLLEEPEISLELRVEVENLSLAEIRRRLQEVDPHSFANIDAENDHRNRRAYLVSAALQKPFSQAPRVGGIYKQYDFFNLCVMRERAELYERINLRVGKMIEAGLVNEVHKLIEMGYTKESAGMNSIGYAQILAHLEGQLSLEEAQQEIALKTRNFAKRQLTWFRNETRLKKIDFAQGYFQLSDHLKGLLNRDI